MAQQGLSEEQKRKIEESRKRALELRQKKCSPQKNVETSSYTNLVKPGIQAQTYNAKIVGYTNQKSLETKSVVKPPSEVRLDTKSSLHHAEPKKTSSSSISVSTGTNSANRFQQYSNPKASYQIQSGSIKSSKPNTNAQTSYLKSGVKNDGVSSKVFYGQPVKGQCILESRETFRVDVAYHVGVVEAFKGMKTKSYDPVSRKWSFKLEEYDTLMKAMAVFKPQVQIEALPKAIIQTFSKQLKGKYDPNTVPDADLSRVDAVLTNSLMPFQRVGVSFAIHKHGRVLIADDMGLGKTIQAICLASYYRDLWPLLVVSPSSVRFDWAQQIQRWLPSVDPQQINVVTSGKTSCTSGLVNVVSYDILARKSEDIRKKRFQVIIMDECHFLKNYKTARTKAALPILQAARKVILLSGTPALSRPSELYTQITAVSPGLFQFNEFGVRYCDGKQQPWGWDFSGSSNMEELQLLLEERIMIRRLKKDVLSQLPAKVRQMVLLDPQAIKESKDLKMSSKLLSHKNLKGMERRGALLEYFHHTCTAKTKAVRDYILDMLESDKKFIVFAHHQEMLDSIQEALETCKSGPQFIRIDGRTTSEERNTLCKRFQTKEDVRVAILSITAANAGLNMAAASVVIFGELFWNPGILVQAEDRAHRLGQVDCVNVHYLVAQGTADDHIWPLIQTKLDVLSKAGLTKDNFSEADTTHMKDSKSKEMRNIFEESFIEEDREGIPGNNSEVSSIPKVVTPTKVTPTKVTPTKITPKKSPGKHARNSNSKAKQSSIDKFVIRTPTKSAPILNPVDEDFEDDSFFESLTSDDMLALTEDVDWDEELQEPDIKKRKM